MLELTCILTNLENEIDECGDDANATNEVPDISQRFENDSAPAVLYIGPSP